MPTSLASERAGVQNPLIGYAVEIGWAYLSTEEALTLRRGEGGTLLYPILGDKLVSLNPGVVTVAGVDQVIAKIESVRNDIEGNAEVLAWLRGERSVYVESENRQRNITLIDFEHPAYNTFHVTDEWQYTNGLHTNRADLLFVVNGIPVALVETRGAAKQEGIDEGIRQVRRYHQETPEMMTAPQVFAVTDLIDVYYGATWNLDRKDIFNWKDEEKGNFERKVKRFFARERFLQLLGEWIVFCTKDDELKKIVFRQHQMRAVEKVVERSLDPVKKRGLIWHTQGSGKTFTMIKAAEQILRHPAFEKPTVVMLVDRNELQGQLSGWMESILGEGRAEIARSKRHLRQILRSDYRGLVVSMIRKFDRADADLCRRDSVFVLVDEAHRSTTGDLGDDLVAALPNATFVGFTGTPVDRIAYGKGTFKVFGKDDPRGYLDTYRVSESVEDGTTVSLHYALAANDVRVPRAQLEEEFLGLPEAGGISDIEELNKILDRAVELKAFLKASDRMEMVARFVAGHFRDNVEPMGYKAFLVGVDREACALYKQALDKYLPAAYSTVVYTAARHDSPLLASYHLSEDDEKKVRKAFVKKDAFPKILIVTERLLTGFDAPILYCMYLDKPMRDHSLLQAIARVNRPYEEEGQVRKPAGLVLDFIGIFENPEKALAFDSEVVAGVIQNITVLEDRFATLMRAQAPHYLALYQGPVDHKTVERAIEAFAEKEGRERFCKFFRELQTLYEIISPDPFLRDYLRDYGRLSFLYELVRNAFIRYPGLYSDIAKKTEGLVREMAEAYGLERTLRLTKIDEETLAALKRVPSSDAVKIINLGKSLMHAVLKEAGKQPYLLPIGERAETILDGYENRQVSTHEALRRLEKLLSEYVQAGKEHEQSGLDPDTFTIYWVLKQVSVPEPQKMAPLLNAAFSRLPNYRHNAADLRWLKAELYRLLLPAVGKERMVELVERVLKLRGR